MELTTTLIKFLLPIVGISVLPLLSPFYLIFKLLKHIKATVNRENVAGKVVLITGASSRIGEHLAYEYARRGARLALAARREDRLRVVSEKAKNLGSPDVIVVRSDVSRIEDCQRFIDEAVKHFGQVDHLINNAGIAPLTKVEDTDYVSYFASMMDINFWVSVHCTRFAIPHLKKNKGKIVGIASLAAYVPTPKLSCYAAALISFYETLRVECGSNVGISIVTPGLIQSEITTSEFLTELGGGRSDYPVESAEVCAKAVVDSACRAW